MTYYPIENFEHYLLGKGEGDNEWSVWRIKKNGELKELKGCIDGSGHIQYGLYSDGNQFRKGLHVLIAEMFITKPKELLESGEKLDVHHKNEDELDNTLSNLCWMTHSEHTSLHKKGKHHSEETKRKLSEALKGKPNLALCRQVFQYDLEGNLIAVWPSTQECERNGYNHENVVNCCLGKRKKHKGYRWSYTPL